MTGIDEAFSELLAEDLPTRLKRFGKEVDAAWIAEALDRSGKASVRRRKLPADHVVWLVIGMGLFRDRSIQEVVAHPGLVLPSRDTADRRSLAPSASVQGRARVGDKPLQHIFEMTGRKWAEAAAAAQPWRGLKRFGVDGSTLRVPDTEDNRDEYHLPGTGRGQSGYPQARVVALMALRSHLIHSAVVGPCSGKGKGEKSLAEALWPAVPDDSRIILDRGFLDYQLLRRLRDPADESGSRHWLTRAKKNTAMKTVREFSDGDRLVDLPTRPRALQRDRTLPRTLRARAISDPIDGGKPQTVLTSLLDPKRYPAREVVALYHERWELEVGYDEWKTHMLERQEALRSKTAVGVLQEIWGILIGYNPVRREMMQVAEAAGVPPLRVRFRHALQLIRVFCLVEAWTTAPGNLPKRLSAFREMLGVLILPERRRDRRYPRHVKIKMSGYKRNTGRPGA